VWGTRTAAVLRGDKVVAKDDDARFDRIEGVFDLDGVEELVVAGGFLNQGFMQLSVAVLHFVRGKLTTVASFENAYAGSCAAVEEQKEDFLVIHAHTKRGAPPRFAQVALERRHLRIDSHDRIQNVLQGRLGHPRQGIEAHPEQGKERALRMVEAGGPVLVEGRA
jgi:hypothetical protein